MTDTENKTTPVIREIKIADVSGFNKRLGEFEVATATSMAAALECGDFAISHFAKCGDLGPAQRFFDSMNSKSKNYTRKAAFAKWFIDFTNVDPEFKDKKFKKIKTKDGEKLNHVEHDMLEAALQGPSWWDHTPEKETWFYSSLEIIKLLNGAVKRCEADKSEALNTGASVTLGKLKHFVETLENPSEVETVS
jgi:uncharacterized cupin superfamily protein